MDVKGKSKEWYHLPRPLVARCSAGGAGLSSAWSDAGEEADDCEGRFESSSTADGGVERVSSTAVVVVMLFGHWGNEWEDAKLSDEDPGYQIKISR